MGGTTQPFIFRIASLTQQLMEIACETEEDMIEWMKAIRECTNVAEQLVSHIKHFSLFENGWPCGGIIILKFYFSCDQCL